MGTRTHDLSDQVTGVATGFATPEDYVPGSLAVYLNGVRQRRGEFFVEAGPHAFTTTEPPLPGDGLAVQYEVAAGGATVLFPTVVPSAIDPARP